MLSSAKRLIPLALQSAPICFSRAYNKINYPAERKKHNPTHPFNKFYASAEEATKDMFPGASIMVGGFGLCGTSENLVKAVAARKDELKNLTSISNNPGTVDYGIGIWLNQGQMKRIICTYIGGNKNFERMWLNGEVEGLLIPQGTLGEKIRSAGCGIPAYYTPTGVGTMVEEGGWVLLYEKGTKKPLELAPGRKRRVFNNRPYIMEETIRADYAFIKAQKADLNGNLYFKYTSRNFNADMCLACDTVIAEVEEIVEPGEMNPDEIHVPGIFVDRIILCKGLEKRIEKLMLNRGNMKPAAKSAKALKSQKVRETIVKRAVKEFRSGMYCNLGVGVPTLVPKFLPKNVKIMLESENGILGMGDYPKPGYEDSDLINAGKETISTIPGSSTFQTSVSFGIIRGKHLNMTCIGGMQVSSKGDLSNWLIPGQRLNGMGGAMDLVGSGTTVMVLMEHTNKGKHKVMQENTMPFTGQGVVTKLCTDVAFFEFPEKNGKKYIKLRDINSEYTLEDVRNLTSAKFDMAEDIGKY